MSKSVYVVGGNDTIKSMFRQEGWNVFQTDMGFSRSLIDLVCFTGGADVDPSLYGHAKHPSTSSSKTRDLYEIAVFLKCIRKGIPMVGICRGAQFLNVMNGGKLYQDVVGHRGSHLAFDHTQDKEIEVTSTHHQMMLPPKSHNDYVVLMHAKCSTERVRYSDDSFNDTRKVMFRDKNPSHDTNPDVEALYFWNTDCLCFQPHPEYVPMDHDCRRTFMAMVRDYLYTTTAIEEKKDAG